MNACSLEAGEQGEARGGLVPLIGSKARESLRHPDPQRIYLADGSPSDSQSKPLLADSSAPLKHSAGASLGTSYKPV